MESIFEVVGTFVCAFLEKCLKGMFSLVEIVNSGDENKIYAINIVIVMTIAVTILVCILTGYYMKSNSKKNVKKKSKKKKKVSKKTLSKSSKTPSKSSKKCSNSKGMVKRKTLKNNATRINVKKEIKTPGVKNTKNNIRKKSVNYKK